MDFSEFLRRLGAEPRSTDPELRAARDQSPEFEAAASEAERFEAELERALRLEAPADLLDELAAIGAKPQASKRWLPMAVAASLLVAVGAAGVAWKMNRSWDSVEAYVIDHYRHDGPQVVAMAQAVEAEVVQRFLADFEVSAEPPLADIVGVIKYCPTPGGKGVHMVLNTNSGPITLIYMPGTAVSDHKSITFDGVEAMLVELPHGSAAIIGNGQQPIEDFYAVVHDSILPLQGSS